MSKMMIFEPAMCCDTGLCGVSVDPELLRISTVINTIKNQGIEVERFNLSASPNVFVSNEAVNSILHKEGMEALPITMIDGQIVKKGAYPTNEELSKLLSISFTVVEETQGTKEEQETQTTIEGSCDCSGGCSEGGCCCS